MMFFAPFIGIQQLHDGNLDFVQLRMLCSAIVTEVGLCNRLCRLSFKQRLPWRSKICTTWKPRSYSSWNRDRDPSMSVHIHTMEHSFRISESLVHCLCSFTSLPVAGLYIVLPAALLTKHVSTTYSAILKHSWKLTMQLEKLRLCRLLNLKQRTLRKLHRTSWPDMQTLQNGKHICYSKPGLTFTFVMLAKPHMQVS